MNTKIEPEKGNALIKISRDTLWLFSVQIITSLMPLLTLPALTKAYSTEVYGAWIQIGVTSNILSTIIGLYLGAALVRFLSVQDSIDRRRTFTYLLLPIIFLGSAIIIAGVLLQYQLSMLIFNNSDYMPLVLPILVSSTIDALISYSMSYFQALRYVKKYSILFMATSGLQVIFTVMLAYIGIDLILLFICIIALRLISLIVILSQIGLLVDRTIIRIRISRKYFAYSLPLMTSGLIYMGGIYSSQYIITHFVSLSEAGIYSVSANLGNLLNFFIAPLSFIVFPLLVKFWANHDTDRIRIYLSHSIELFLFIAVPASGGLCILSQYLITIFANSSYAAGSFLVLLISLGTIFSGIYIANVSVMQLTSQTRWIPIMVLASSSVLISGNIILIPLLGITGSGIAYALSYFVLATIATIYAVKYTHYRISSYFVLKIIASTSIMILALSLIPINSWLSIVLAIIVGIITYSISIFLFRAFSRRDLQLFREIVTNMLNSNISA